MTISGLDYASWRPPSPAWLPQHGYHFVCRYFAIGGSWKRMSVSEYHSLRAAGVSVVLNAEGSDTQMKGGYSQGVADAKACLAEAHALGVPHPVVYFSADWDVSWLGHFAVNNYLRGAASVLGGPEFVGVYGSYNCVKWAYEAKVCRWFWQTYGWSGGRWHAAAQLRQTHNGVLGGGADLDVAMVSNFGQIGAPVPAPHPVPTPTPTPPITPRRKKVLFVRATGKKSVFITDYVTRRWVQTDAQFHELSEWMKTQGLDVGIKTVTFLDSFGPVVGQDPGNV